MSTRVTSSKGPVVESERFPDMANAVLLIGGTAHPSLNKSVSEALGLPLANVAIKRFSDGECSVRVHDNVRGRDVFLLQTCAAPVNDSIMELLLTLSAVRRAGAQRVTAVVPYFGYKHHRRGLPVSATMDSRFLSSNAKDFAKMLTQLGVDRVISVDLQRPGQGGEACFFDNQVPLESLVTTKLMAKRIAADFMGHENNVCVVAPNAEGITKARKFQWAIEEAVPEKDVSFATYFHFDHFGSGPSDPRRFANLNSAPVQYRDVLIVDDLIDTAGTVAELSRKLRAQGASKVFAVAGHGIFSHDALEALAKAPVERVYVTDSIPAPTATTALAQAGLAKLEYISIAENLADLIRQEFRRSNQIFFDAKEDDEDDFAVEHDDQKVSTSDD